MLDLKPYQDAAIAADADVQRVAGDIDVLFRKGTDESKEEALALRPALDAAQSKHATALELYESMKKSSQPSSVMQNFVNVSTTAPTPEAEKPKTVMTLAEFTSLSPRERLAFAKRGGKINEKED